MVKKLALATTLFMLAGCETASSFSGVGQQGAMSAVSCNQINSTFSAYQRDKQSLSALAQIAGYTNTDISNATPENAASYYQNILAAANIALLTQGCPLIQP